MAKTQDITAMMKDMMGAFPVDTTAMEDAFKTTATLNEKLSGVALEAAEKSTEISSKWTKDTLAKLADMSKAKAEPADYAKAMTDFASASAEVAAENMAAFAEIAKKVQMDTVELMMAAGKDMHRRCNCCRQESHKRSDCCCQESTLRSKRHTICTIFLPNGAIAGAGLTEPALSFCALATRMQVSLSCTAALHSWGGD